MLLISTKRSMMPSSFAIEVSEDTETRVSPIPLCSGSLSVARTVRLKDDGRSTIAPSSIVHRPSSKERKQLLYIYSYLLPAAAQPLGQQIEGQDRQRKCDQWLQQQPQAGATVAHAAREHAAPFGVDRIDAAGPRIADTAADH